MLKSLIAFLFITTAAFSQVKAQNHIDGFLSDVSIKEFHLGSKIDDVKKNVKLSDEIADLVIDNESTYILKKNIDILGIAKADPVSLGFKDAALTEVTFEAFDDSEKNTFLKMYNVLKKKYGEPESKPMGLGILKNSQIKTYTWKNGNTELMMKPLQFSFIVNYKKNSPRSTHWMYQARSGQGNNSIRLTISALHQMIKQGTTLSDFERRLPAWKTTGTDNHIHTSLNLRSHKMESRYQINYQLSSCTIVVTTADTVAKKIDYFNIKNIQAPMIVSNLRKELANRDYKLDDYKQPALLSYIEKTYYNQKDRTMVSVTNTGKGFEFDIF